MTRTKPLTSMMAALALLLCLPTLAAQPPKEAVGTDTMLMLWVDVEQVDTEMIAGIGEALMQILENEMLQDQELALPLGDTQKMIDSLSVLRGSFLQAGGEGLLMTVDMPGEDSWSPPMNLLAKVSDKVDTKSMASLVRAMGEGEMEAKIEPVADGWQNIAIRTLDGQGVTMGLPKPDADVFTAFEKQLTQAEKPVLAVAFRMQEELRKMMDEAEQLAKNQQAGPGEDPQAQMAMGMLMGMFKPIRALDTLGIVVSQDKEEEMQVDVQMAFLDAQNAQMFANLYNSILMFAPVMMAQAGQGGQIENMPDPNTVNSFFMKLKMQVAGDTLKLKLDKDFFELAEKMAPLFEGMAPEPGEGLNL